MIGNDSKLEVCNRAGAKLQASMWNKCVVGPASVTLVPQLITTWLVVFR